MTMTITYRSEKGSPLTSDEIDTNFRELATRLTHLEDHTETAEGLDKIHLEGDQLTFTGTLGKTFGTFTLPQPTTPSKPSLPVYEKTSLPQDAPLGQLAFFLEKEDSTLIFFNGNHWNRLLKGDKI